jgi:TorA maturation chaperone TorD
MNTVTEDTPIDAEEQARADLYGLLSRLLAAPADSELLQGIAAIPLSEGASAQPGENAFVHAWSALVHSAATAQAGAIADEYHDLFVGSGRAEVTLYTGAYTARSSVETQLVALREYLAAQGLQRQTGVHEPEPVSGARRALVVRCNNGASARAVLPARREPNEKLPVR